ncbi:MAG: anchored repeat-type ABC transporter permease subunit [Actinomycetaceae bacterium]|nr:anchored repeat-type ABC transporter permease subunit [Actinomycetaceae bacterium]
MISFIDFLRDLSNPALAFLPKALIVSVMAAGVCAIIGAHVVLRGMAFIGDAVAHAVFPGIAVAFVFQGSLLLGGAVAGLLVALLVAVFSQGRQLKEDSVIGIFFAAAFALGLVIISRVPGYTGSLQSFLFGSITGVPTSDVVMTAGIGLLIVGAVLMLNKELVSVTLDRETSKAAGLPVFWLDIFLYVAVTMAVVISVRTIGNILVLALLITPAATARLLTNKLSHMFVLGPILGGLCAFVGIYLSWAIDLPTGATIVLCVTAVFLLAWVYRAYKAYRGTTNRGVSLEVEEKRGSQGLSRVKTTGSVPFAKDHSPSLVN